MLLDQQCFLLLVLLHSHHLSPADSHLHSLRGSRPHSRPRNPQDPLVNQASNQVPCQLDNQRLDLLDNPHISHLLDLAYSLVPVQVDNLLLFLLVNQADVPPLNLQCILARNPLRGHLECPPLNPQCVPVHNQLINHQTPLHSLAACLVSSPAARQVHSQVRSQAHSRAVCQVESLVLSPVADHQKTHPVSQVANQAVAPQVLVESQRTHRVDSRLPHRVDSLARGQVGCHLLSLAVGRLRNHPPRPQWDHHLNRRQNLPKGLTQEDC